MQRLGVMLYNKYVDEKVLAKRLQKRTDVTLAPYLELNYRKNLYQRMEALGTPAVDSDINDNV